MFSRHRILWAFLVHFKRRRKRPDSQSGLQVSNTVPTSRQKTAAVQTLQECLKFIKTYSQKLSKTPGWLTRLYEFLSSILKHKIDCLESMIQTMQTPTPQVHPTPCRWAGARCWWSAFRRGRGGRLLVPWVQHAHGSERDFPGVLRPWGRRSDERSDE